MGGQVVIELAHEGRALETGGPDQAAVVTRVRDHGPGVPEADVAHLFEPFFTSKAPGRGTGLGLWLAEGIARDHGGLIEVENRSGGGACFAIVLPESEV